MKKTITLDFLLKLAGLSVWLHWKQSWKAEERGRWGAGFLMSPWARNYNIPQEKPESIVVKSLIASIDFYPKLKVSLEWISSSHNRWLYKSKWKPSYSLGHVLNLNVSRTSFQPDMLKFSWTRVRSQKYFLKKNAQQRGWQASMNIQTE